jgi:type III secretion protein U
MSEKTEEPTHKKLTDARKKGQVAKSADLIVMVQLAVTLGYLWMRGPGTWRSIEGLIEITIDSINLPVEAASDRILGAFLELIMQFLLPLGGLLVIATIVGSFLQTGPVLASEAIGVKGERLNFINNAKQLFSAKTVVEFVKSVLKVGTLAAIFYFLLYDNLGSFQFLPMCGTACGINLTSHLIATMWIILVVAYVVIGGLDLLYQRYRTNKDLRMSKEEVKQEYKNSEGDPHVKGHRKEVHREMQSGSLASKVKKSTAIVRNPTHVAVCLYYKAGETPLPMVLEKGHDLLALTIIELGQQAGVPIIENVPLARALAANTPRGKYIPPEMFVPVAELLRMIEELAAEPSDDALDDVPAEAPANTSSDNVAPDAAQTKEEK